MSYSELRKWGRNINFKNECQTLALKWCEVRSIQRYGEQKISQPHSRKDMYSEQWRHPHSLYQLMHKLVPKLPKLMDITWSSKVWYKGQELLPYGHLMCACDEGPRMVVIINSIFTFQEQARL